MGFREPDDDFTVNLNSTFGEAQHLLMRKHQDYGPHNIGRAPGGPLNGLAVRLHDKVARLAHLMGDVREPKNESLRDTFMDIMNYGAIGVMVVDGKWPTE